MSNIEKAFSLTETWKIKKKRISVNISFENMNVSYIYTQNSVWQTSSQIYVRITSFKYLCHNIEMKIQTEIEK